MRRIVTTGCAGWLLIMMVVGCGPAGETDEPESVTELKFEAYVGDEPLSCTESFDDFGDADAPVDVTDFRFYIHDVEVIDSDGEHHRVELIDDGVWQNERVALVDFTDRHGHCEHASSATNDTVELAVDAEHVEAIGFSIGVPFELNHDDVATADSPLSLPAMFWNWNAGYKFLRIDTESGDDAAFRFHLGSHRCRPAADGGVEGCDDPNRPRVQIDSIDVDNQVLRFELAALFAGTDATRSTENTPMGCMSMPDDPDCEGLFEVLGLADGTVVDESVIQPVERGDSDR